MTAQQIKSEIQKVLDNIPEDVLEDILNYLLELQEKSENDVNRTFDLKKILQEDKELLQKLAQ